MRSTQSENEASRTTFEAKIVAIDSLAQRVRVLARPLVFTNGVFDVLHRGHVTYLAQARALGASLVVAVNSDRSVRSLDKGLDRPLNNQADRAAILAALEAVTLVTIFDDSVPLASLEIVRPDIYVKGGDYDVNAIPEAAACRALGGKSIAIAFEHERSTTFFLARVREAVNRVALLSQRRLSARALWGPRELGTAARRGLLRFPKTVALAGCGALRRTDDCARDTADRQPARVRYYLGGSPRLAARLSIGTIDVGTTLFTMFIALSTIGLASAPSSGQPRAC